MLAHCLGIPESNIRCIAPDIGGGFGIKASILPHEIIVAILAMKLGVPVKYYEDRREHLTASKHGYARVSYVKVARKEEDGTITAWKEKIIQDDGAYEYVGNRDYCSTIFYAARSVQDSERTFSRRLKCVPQRQELGHTGAFGDAQMIFVREVMIDKVAKSSG